MSVATSAKGGENNNNCKRCFSVDFCNSEKPFLAAEIVNENGDLEVNSNPGSYSIDIVSAANNSDVDDDGKDFIQQNLEDSIKEAITQGVKNNSIQGGKCYELEMYPCSYEVCVQLSSDSKNNKLDYPEGAPGFRLNEVPCIIPLPIPPGAA
jgi:hypothetical protein